MVCGYQTEWTHDVQLRTHSKIKRKIKIAQVWNKTDTASEAERQQDRWMNTDAKASLNILAHTLSIGGSIRVVPNFRYGNSSINLRVSSSRPILSCFMLKT